MDRRSWNPIFTVRWDDLVGAHTVKGTAREIHRQAPALSRRGDTGQVWDIAVLDEHGTDVTARFFDHLDTA